MDAAVFREPKRRFIAIDSPAGGGEMAALVLLDACVRLIPGVMGKELSGEDESFENGLLEYPHYTRPREWEGRSLPEALLSGDHARIAKWRHEQAVEKTQRRNQVNHSQRSVP
jgi:tRNA (guanine37-N1)-methyltransferase